MTAGPEPRPQWLRNLAALWVAQFTAIFGFSFAFPFLPLYLHDLGISDPHLLPVWSGVAAGASGAALAVMSPIWGRLADRFGRRQMLLRAMAGGAVTVALMGLAQSPDHIVVLRFLQGASSGTIAASTALVAAGTPRHRVAWAMGVLGSAVAVGSAVGPTAGGLLAAVIGIRSIFLVAGALLAAAILPVLLVVREPPYERRTGTSPRLMDAVRATGPGALAALAALIVCQALLQLSYSGFQPLLTLRILDLVGGAAATSITGVTFGISGLAAAVGSVLYSRPVAGFGYVAVIAVAAVGLAAAELACGALRDLWVIVVAGGVAGLFYGVVGPAISAMIGLEAPVAVQASVFGVSSSATAVGFAIGPLAGGEVGAVSVSYGMALAAAFAILMVFVIALKGREPLR